jgi:hypothetical protein
MRISDTPHGQRLLYHFTTDVSTCSGDQIVAVPFCAGCVLHRPDAAGQQPVAKTLGLLSWFLRTKMSASHTPHTAS